LGYQDMISTILQPLEGCFTCCSNLLLQ